MRDRVVEDLEQYQRAMAEALDEAADDLDAA